MFVTIIIKIKTIKSEVANANLKHQKQLVISVLLVKRVLLILIIKSSLLILI